MSSTSFAKLPDPPYYAVIFSSQRTPGDNGYGEMSDRMVELAAMQPGFLGIESTRDEQGFGITVAYFDTLKNIAQWKANSEHLQAQAMGHRVWYEHFELRIAKVERAYGKPQA